MAIVLCVSMGLTIMTSGGPHLLCDILINTLVLGHIVYIFLLTCGKKSPKKVVKEAFHFVHVCVFN